METKNHTCDQIVRYCELKVCNLTLMKKVFIVFIFFSAHLSVFSQAFAIDPTFQPFFDIRTGPGKGDTYSLIEDYPSGKIYLVGSFRFIVGPGRSHGGLTSTLRDGSLTPGYNSFGINANNSIIKISDTSHLVASQGRFVKIDTFGNILDTAWQNQRLRTSTCYTGNYPYFFKDGSSLMPNYQGGLPGSCDIRLDSSTYPQQFLLKLKPNAEYDRTFTPALDYQPNGIFQYDTNRLLVFGQPRDLITYNGHVINGLCRIFYNGQLDTTFSSPIRNTGQGQGILIDEIDQDGSFFLVGNFYLKSDTLKVRHIVKLKPNGEIDSSFNFWDTPKAITSPGFGGVSCVTKTIDGGYLIGGRFDKYQGHSKRNIAKVDSAGIVEPHFFTSIGPDSSLLFGSGWASVGNIIKSKLGGYYVLGDFLKWDGQPTQPIVRINDLSVGIKEDIEFRSSIQIFPNPVKDVLKLELDEPIDEGEIVITNVLGQTQLRQKIRSSSRVIHLNIHSLQPGIHFLKFNNERVSFSKKFVKL